MRRRQLSAFIIVVFITWNVMTYLLIANRSNNKDGVVVMSRQDAQRRLAELEGRLRAQAGLHASLLKQLEEARIKLQKQLIRDAQLAHTGRRSLPSPPQPSEAAIDPHKVTIPVLVIACNRVTVRRHLDQLLRFRPSATRFPIVVSQDCNHGPTADVIRSYGDKVIHIQQPDQRDFRLPWKERKFQGYYKISRHYKWALQQIFHKFKHHAVIIVEDDLDISPDFFEYFAATFPVLHSDPSLWCVSAWNDNGKAGSVGNEPEMLHRTDFFPGLGWMLERKTFLQLEANWPQTFWDDWMRHPDQRKDRACIRPEISRTYTFGKIGVSKGQFFEKHLKFIKLNDKPVLFTKKDLTYLHKNQYDAAFVRTVYGAPLLTLGQVISGVRSDLPAVRVQYSDKAGYKTQAKQLGLMEDLKSGVPRMAYRGVVTFMYRGRRTFLAPPSDWKAYDTTWN